LKSRIMKSANVEPANVAGRLYNNNLQDKKFFIFMAILNSSEAYFPQTPPPFCDWLYSDRLHAID
ncbi:hypothetical protein T11_11411, partial [Trichinella zimbabwensis]